MTAMTAATEALRLHPRPPFSQLKKVSPCLHLRKNLLLLT